MDRATRAGCRPSLASCRLHAGTGGSRRDRDPRRCSRRRTGRDAVRRRPGDLRVRTQRGEDPATRRDESALRADVVSAADRPSAVAWFRCDTCFSEAPRTSRSAPVSRRHSLAARHAVASAPGKSSRSGDVSPHRLSPDRSRSRSHSWNPAFPSFNQAWHGKVPAGSYRVSIRPRISGRVSVSYEGSESTQPATTVGVRVVVVPMLMARFSLKHGQRSPGDSRVPLAHQFLSPGRRARQSASAGSTSAAAATS
jgi:hypothetical protein